MSAFAAGEFSNKYNIPNAFKQTLSNLNYFWVIFLPK